MKDEDLDLPSLAGQLPGLIREVYGDLAKPGVRQVGKALGTVLGIGNTILWPIAWTNERSKIALEKNLERYRRKMEGTPEDEVCEVAPELGVPIAEKLSYVTNEELTEMYTELLSKASRVQDANVAHPSFVNIINNISPDEAILLKSIRHVSAIPFVEVRFKRKGSREFTTLHPLLVKLDCLPYLKFGNSGPAYFSNLEGLGILEVRLDTMLARKESYEELEKHAERQYAQLDKIEDRVLVFQRGQIAITSLGQLFLQACFTSGKQ